MVLNPRAQATVLLTVPFPKESAGIAPLSPSEWGRFAAWLQERGLAPESLLLESNNEFLHGLDIPKITPNRVQALLERGTALGLLADKWSRAGLWVMTRADPDYPSRLKRRLGAVSPAVLFGCGRRALLEGGGLAVVGSRHASTEDLAYSRRLGELAANNGYSVVSGGARGVDEAAMLGALESEGTAVGVLANGLLQASTSLKFRDALAGSNLVLVAATNPEAGFTVGNAMGRNKYIYCLADAAVVVHSGPEGGTWSGATENLKKGWVAVWVKETTDPGAGNHALLREPGVRRLSLEPDRLSFTFFARPDEPPPTTNLAGAPALQPAEQPTLMEAPDAPALSFYELFLRKLRDVCYDAPCRPDELQEALKLTQAQLDVWLKQAVADGQLVKLTKPVRYQVSRQLRAFQ